MFQEIQTDCKELSTSYAQTINAAMYSTGVQTDEPATVEKSSVEAQTDKTEMDTVEAQTDQIETNSLEAQTNVTQEVRFTLEFTGTAFCL